MADHGTRTRYRNGCNDGPGGQPCTKCRAAEADAKRRQRAKRPDAPKGSLNVVALPTITQPPQAGTPPSMGPCEQGVRADLESLPRAAERQGIAAAAIALAQRIDDPGHAAMVARNSHELRNLMDQLSGPRKKSGGRLATISAMSGHHRRAQ